jgi:hydroxymethylpyrimidine pyrophosphatase-like HAD family hydrolase
VTVAIQCVYTDLDNTMLGRGASILRDAEGNFSMLAVRALEACHRAAVEVVIKSGRRKAQVYEDARLIGQRSYIYEMGCGLVDGPEELFLTGVYEPLPDRSVHQQIEETGVPALLIEAFPGRLEYHSPWHEDRLFSHLFRGEVELSEVEALLAASGHDDLRLVDNGITERRSETLRVATVHTYHLIPRAAGKANAVAAHMRRRGLTAEQCIAIGDSRGDLEVASVVGRFYLVANALQKDRDALGAAGPARDRVTVTEEPMSAGFYEAVVRSLAEGRPTGV